MWARIEHRDTQEKDAVVELVNFDPYSPVQMYSDDLVFHKVPEWLRPYIDYTYWWDAASQSFQNLRGYEDALDKAKIAQEALFQTAFGEIECRRARSVATVAEYSALGFPQADYAEDLNILGQLNMVVEDNRTLRKQIAAIALPTPATEESAKTALADIAKITPWLPWAPQSALEV